MMKGIISPPQRAFIEGKQILDEYIDDKRLYSKSGVICKLELEKTYDHVN